MPEGADLNFMPYLFGLLGIAAVAAVVLHVYFAIALMVMAGKTRTSSGWMAWFPILNLFLMCNIGRRSPGWVLGLLVPGLNLFVIAMLWASMAAARGKPAWTGPLVLLPPINLLIPIYLAAGRATAPGVMAGPRVCGRCGMPAVPTDAFCGNCGFGLPPPPQPSAQMRAPSLGRAAGAAFVMLILIVGIAGVSGWYFIGRTVEYTPPQRQASAIPPRMAGTMIEFPVDAPGPDAARPTSVVTQDFRSGPMPPSVDGKTSSAPKVQVPPDWLPPGIESASIPDSVNAMTSATYRTGEGLTTSSNGAEPTAGNTSPSSPTPPSGHGPLATPSGTDGGANDVPVYVHVLSTATTTSQSAVVQWTGNIARATGGQQTGVSLRTVGGYVYQGSRIRTDRVSVYVLARQGGDSVVMIYTPQSSGFATADRLARSVANGRGLYDYPGVQSTLWLLPPSLPAGLALREVNSWSADDLGLTQRNFDAAASGTSDADARRAIAAVRQFVPGRVIVSRYGDLSGQDYHMLVCDLGSARKALNLWLAFRWTAGIKGWQSAKVNGVEGRYIESADERVLLFQKGPYFVLIVQPRQSSVDVMVDLAGRMQL